MELLIRTGHRGLPGLCLALVDWSAELRLLLAAKTKKSRRGGTLAAGGSPFGEPQPLIE
jgi:hypothetical protein